jgi:hypothetical protein
MLLTPFEIRWIRTTRTAKVVIAIASMTILYSMIDARAGILPSTKRFSAHSRGMNFISITFEMY